MSRNSGMTPRGPMAEKEDSAMGVDASSGGNEQSVITIGKDDAATIRSFRSYVNTTRTIMEEVVSFVTTARKFVSSILPRGRSGYIQIGREVGKVPAKDNRLSKRNLDLISKVVAFSKTEQDGSLESDVAHALHGHLTQTWGSTRKAIEREVSLKRDGVSKSTAPGWDWGKGEKAEEIRKAMNSLGGVSYYRGSDWKALYKLYSILPVHDRYVEVYPGNGLFWAKPKSKEEILVEPDKDMALLYRYIRRLTPNDVETLSDKDWVGSSELYEELAKNVGVKDTIVDFVYRMLYLRRFGTKKEDSFVFNSSEESISYGFTEIAERISDRMKSVSVRSADIDVLDSLDNENTLFVFNLTGCSEFVCRPEEFCIDSAMLKSKVVIVVDAESEKIVSVTGDGWNRTELADGYLVFSNYSSGNSQYTWSTNDVRKAYNDVVAPVQGITSYPAEVYAIVSRNGDKVSVSSEFVALSDTGVLVLRKSCGDVDVSDDKVEIESIAESIHFLNAPLGVFEKVDKTIHSDVSVCEPWFDRKYLGKDLGWHLLASGLDGVASASSSSEGVSVDSDSTRIEVAKGYVVWGIQEVSSGLSEFFVEFDDASHSSGRWLVRKSGTTFEVGMPADQSPAISSVNDVSDIFRIIKCIGGNGDSLDEIVDNSSVIPILQSVDYPYLPADGNASPLDGSVFVRLLVSKSEDAPKEERLVYGIVLEPDVIDAHKDVISAEEIRAAAHRFMELYGGQVGVQHRFQPKGLIVLESYIAPADFTIYERKIKRGTWLLVVRVMNDAVWARIKLGLVNPTDPQAFTGFSVQGMATIQRLQQPTT